mmetsp:Transcript_1453/g.3192  ORF Transcript_1453/g.3192 Transcript_1453/m.3192 type:complete len:341 (+) Transcript_1453:1119-2141(+)
MPEARTLRPHRTNPVMSVLAAPSELLVPLKVRETGPLRARSAFVLSRRFCPPPFPFNHASNITPHQPAQRSLLPSQPPVVLSFPLVLLREDHSQGPHSLHLLPPTLSPLESLYFAICAYTSLATIAIAAIAIPAFTLPLVHRSGLRRLARQRRRLGWCGDLPKGGVPASSLPPLLLAALLQPLQRGLQGLDLGLEALLVPGRVLHHLKHVVVHAHLQLRVIADLAQAVLLLPGQRHAALNTQHIRCPAQPPHLLAVLMCAVVEVQHHGHKQVVEQQHHTRDVHHKVDGAKRLLDLVRRVAVRVIQRLPIQEPDGLDHAVADAGEGLVEGIQLIQGVLPGG